MSGYSELRVRNSKASRQGESNRLSVEYNHISVKL
jgi:hypothetical protein